MRSLHALARAAGLETDYTNFEGHRTVTSDESLVAMLKTLVPDLGIAFSSVNDAPAAMTALEHLKHAEIVPPVVIGWGRELVVPFSVVADQDSPWEVVVTTESGQTVRASGRMFHLPASDHTHGREVRCVRRATIEVGEHGYHQVAWTGAHTGGEAVGICAPEVAWGAPGQGKRRWGVFAPVYGLANARTGETGDLSTLRQLMDGVAARGGSYVATLPVLAQFLDEPCVFSPYSPASRIAWNELYLDLGELAGLVGAPAPVAPPARHALIEAGRTRGRSGAEGRGGLIDYREAYHWRRHALDPIALALMAHPEHGKAIDAWAIETGAYDYAAFRALGEQFKTGWHSWPAPYKDHLPGIRDHAAAVAANVDTNRLVTHVVAQWAMQRQLDALAQHDVGLYLDLPVGVNADAYEVWRHRKLFLLDASTGAPPDPLFLGGQDWGLPPLSPIALRRDGYRLLIRAVRHHMRVSKMLRVDHVMGLFRLYCVPKGFAATDGTYVKYAYDEVLAILAIESHRNQCAVAGEDLGTVPDVVRPAMERHGLYRLHVGQWYFPKHPADQPELPPKNSVASLNTHDTPTFAGWWQGSDTQDRLDLGLITEKQAVVERDERACTKAELIKRADAAIVGGALNDAERAMLSATIELAAGPAEVMLVALDDLALDPVPHNVPGTVEQRPNWQRRITAWETALSDSSASPVASATIAAVVAARTR